MARPQRLSEAQIAELFDPPTEQRDLVRHFALSWTTQLYDRREEELTLDEVERVLI